MPPTRLGTRAGACRQRRGSPRPRRASGKGGRGPPARTRPVSSGPIGSLPDQALHLPLRERRDATHRLRLLQSGPEEGIGLDYLADQPIAWASCGQPSGGKENVSGDAQRRALALRPATARAEAEQTLRQTEAGTRTGNDDVAAEDDLEPAAECVAVDGGDDGLRESIEVPEGSRPSRWYATNAAKSWDEYSPMSAPATNALPAP